MSPATGTRFPQFVASFARCPVKDCTIPVDIELRSSDNRWIGAHKANLAQFSAGFPLPEPDTRSDQVVDLEESSDVLNLLMQFMHDHKFPTLYDTPFESILKLTEASDKYMVQAAMDASLFAARYVGVMLFRIL